MINIKFPFICESERTYRYMNACVCTHTTQKQEEAQEGKTMVREKQVKEAREGRQEYADGEGKMNDRSP